MSKLKFTLKSWPVIAGATIGLCYLTQAVAELFGVKLAEQFNIVQVRRMGVYTWQALTNWPLAQALQNEVVVKFLANIPLVLIVMPAVEEFIFRYLLFRLPLRKIKTAPSFLLPFSFFLSSALFSAAHYLAQPWPDNAFVALFFFGLAQCWLYRKTERIWCPMLNHALFNLTNLVLLFVLPEAT